MSKNNTEVKKQSLLSSFKNPAQVRSLWHFFQKLPLGKTLFSRMMGLFIPYTGKISAKVQKIESGYAEVELNDRRKIRNHLNSIHAIALANVGEFCCGLALFSQVPAHAQAILVNLSCSYFKKARGKLMATSSCHIEAFHHNTDYTLSAEIKDAAQNVVALVSTTWRIRLS